MAPLWEALTDEQKDKLVELIVVKSYRRDEVIFREGDEVSHMMFLLNGSVAIYNKGTTNRQHLIRMVETCGFFGYQSAFEDSNQQISAIAGYDATVIMTPMSYIFHLIWENPNVAMFFIKELASKLGTSVRHTIILSQKHIRGRMADCLLQVKNKYGTERDGQTIAMYLSRENLANMSNMTTSNAIRTLSSFAQEGVIELAGRKIRIIDEEKLIFISRTG